MKDTIVLIEKIKMGDHITDKELNTAIVFFREVTWGLKALGETFHHAWLDTFMTLQRLEGYRDARLEKS